MGGPPPDFCVSRGRSHSSSLWQNRTRVNLVSGRGRRVPPGGTGATRHVVDASTGHIYAFVICPSEAVSPRPPSSATADCSPVTRPRLGHENNPSLGPFCPCDSRPGFEGDLGIPDTAPT